MAGLRPSITNHPPQPLYRRPSNRRFMHSVTADSSRPASIGLVALLLLSTLVAMTPTVSALTGNESVTGTVVDTVSGTVTASNLDANDDYRWLVFIYWPSGSLMDSDGGYVVNQGVTSFTEDANWTTAHRAGNYSVSFRLYEYPSSTLLDMYNTTFYSPGVANLTTLDQYEPNNGQTVTTPILVNSTTSNANLNSSSDYDWYEYNVTSTGEVFVNVTFDHEEVKRLLNCRRKTGSSSSTVVDSSHSDTDDESCRFNATTTGIYYLEMTSVGGAGWYNFTLEMDVPPPPALRELRLPPGARAVPKSLSRAVLSPSSRMLLGFPSRWSIFWRCAYVSAPPMSAMILRTTSGSRPAASWRCA